MRSLSLANDHLPSLDGLRAFAVTLVLFYHANHWGEGFPAELRLILEFLPDGRWGVALFFYISGFIITYLLLNEELQNGTISLPKFYARRALRILPVYYVFLFVVFGLQIGNNPKWHHCAYIAPLTFTTGAWCHDSPYVLAHFWSLAVEAQFYFLWPPVFLVFRNSSRIAVLATVVVSMPVIRGLLRRAYPELELIPLANAVDSFAWGGLLALLYPQLRDFFGQIRHRQRCGIELLLAGFILFEYTVFTHRWLEHGQFFLSFARSAAIAVFIGLVVAFPEMPISRMLNWRAAKMLGAFSYSIYVWQQFFTQPGDGPEVPFWARFPGNLIASIFVGIISYYVLEKPVLRLRRHFSRS